jgi:hypothetical protein
VRERTLEHIYDFGENSRIKIVMAKVEKSRISFETVKAKTVEGTLPLPLEK